MSIKAMSIVWDVPFPNVETKMIVLKMADCGNDDGDNIFPSVGTVERATGCSQTTVKKYLKQLDACGLMPILEQSQGGNQTNGSRRRLDIEMLLKCAQPKPHIEPELEIVFEGEGSEKRIVIKSRGSPDDGVAGRPGSPGVIQGDARGCQGGRPATPTLKRTSSDPSLSGGGGKFQFIFDQMEGDQERIANLFLIPVVETIRVEHSNPTGLFRQVAKLLANESNEILGAAVDQVSKTRKKIISPRCLTDCVELAKQLAREQQPVAGKKMVTILKADNQQQFAAWVTWANGDLIGLSDEWRRRASFIRKMTDQFNSTVLDVSQAWPPTQAEGAKDPVQ